MRRRLVVLGHPRGRGGVDRQTARHVAGRQPSYSMLKRWIEGDLIHELATAGYRLFGGGELPKLPFDARSNCENLP
jgi:hypothetical protein